MSHPTPSNPPQPTSKADALDASAKAKASNSPAVVAQQPCPKPWRLHVLAVTKNKEKGKGTVLITAGTRSASVPFFAGKQFTETQGTEFTHDVPESFDVAADAEDWIAEAPKPVSMQNGDVKTEILTLRPRPWIGFQFIDEKTTKNVAGIKLSLKLPKKGDVEETSIDGELKIPKLDPGVGEVKKALCDDVVWSVEKVE
jgi:hypothetical protein